MATRMLMLIEELPSSPIWPHPVDDSEQAVREAMAVIAGNLEAQAFKHHVNGWAEKGAIEYTSSADGSAVIGKLFMERPNA